MRQRSDLRRYQDDIATFLYEHDEALCVVRPGGGKTVSALTAFKELLDEGVVRHAIVMAPKRVARNVWPEEIANWAHTKGLRYQVLTGTPAKRELQLRAAPAFDLTIAGLDIAQWLMEQLDRYTTVHQLFDMLIIDEISRLRNPTGKRAKEIAKRTHKWKMIWGLTGTLRPNGPEDMFTPARVVTRGKLWGKSFYKWRQERFYPTDYMGYRWAAKPGEEEKINAEIAPHIVTLAEGDMPQIPPLTVITDHIDLPTKARFEYDTMERKLFARGDVDYIVAKSTGVASGKLAQAANGFMYDNQKRVVQLHDEKREWLQDLIEEATGPLLVIYEFIEDLRMVMEVAGQETPYLGAGAGDRDSDSAIEAWNAGDLKVMAMHPASGGHGLNLQPGGSDMAWISPCWSPEYWEQTIARLHRSGQKNPVMVRICVARETVDELKVARVIDKVSAQNAFERYISRRQEALKI
jgi:SNF2 family DNA or RNA helicase